MDDLRVTSQKREGGTGTHSGQVGTHALPPTWVSLGSGTTDDGQTDNAAQLVKGQGHDSSWGKMGEFGKARCWMGKKEPTQAAIVMIIALAFHSFPKTRHGGEGREVQAGNSIKKTCQVHQCLQFSLFVSLLLLWL